MYLKKLMEKCGQEIIQEPKEVLGLSSQLQRERKVGTNNRAGGCPLFIEENHLRSWKLPHCGSCLTWRLHAEMLNVELFAT